MATKPVSFQWDWRNWTVGIELLTPPIVFIGPLIIFINSPPNISIPRMDAPGNSGPHNNAENKEN